MRHAPALLTAALALGACATAPSAETSDAAQAETQHSSAILFVERQAGDGASAGVHLGARFVQYGGIATEALPELLGTPHLALPGAAVCSERVEPVVDSDAHAEARLLDVGAIDVRAGDRAAHLEPRRFPDLWNVVSGVIYASDGDLAGDTWHFSAAGNPATHMAGFDVDARAPEDLANVSFADQALTPDAAVAVPRRAFSVRWNRGEHEDTVAVTFESPASADRSTTVDCVAHDDGALDVDATWAERVADLTAGGGAISVHRLRTRAFSGPQMDAATVVFDLSIRARGE